MASLMSSDGAAESPVMVALTDYVVLEDKLGEGGFGSVHKAQHKTNPKDEIAVKKVAIKFENCKCEGRCKCAKKYLEREREFVDTLKTCDHGNIVRFLGWEDMVDDCYIMLELCDQSLKSLFKNAKVEVLFDRSVAYMCDMASGIEYLHSKEIVHRDLKPENVLEKDNCLKVADFGLARYISENTTVTSAVGTPSWAAPETRGGKPMDVFALGLVFLAILMHKVGEALTVFKVTDVALGPWMRALHGAGHKVTVPDFGIPRATIDGRMRMALDLIKDMLEYDSTKRISITGVCERLKELDIKEFRVMIRKKTATRLPFTAAEIVGMNSWGDTILGEYKGSRLFMWTRSHGEMTQRWSRDLPSNIEPDCSKAVTGTGHALLKKYSGDPTIMLREDGEVTTWRHEGRLLTCLPPERPVYRQQKEAGVWEDWEIVIVDQQEERRLRSPPGYTWGWYLSVCESRGRVAVVDLGKKSTLSIFHEYNHLTTVPLEYQPGPVTAVCCSQDHLFVAEHRPSSSIHIYSWEGIETQTISLDVGRGDYIRCVTYIDSEKTLQAAVGGRWPPTTHSLHALQLDLKYSPEEKAKQEGLMSWIARRLPWRRTDEDGK